MTSFFFFSPSPWFAAGCQLRGEFLAKAPAITEPKIFWEELPPSFTGEETEARESEGTRLSKQLVVKEFLQTWKDEYVCKEHLPNHVNVETP